jgi:hypothetical protein
MAIAGSKKGHKPIDNAPDCSENLPTFHHIQQQVK